MPEFPDGAQHFTDFFKRDTAQNMFFKQENSSWLVFDFNSQWVPIRPADEWILKHLKPISELNNS